MRYVFKVAAILLPVVVLALGGCGGSSGGGSSADPFSATSTGGTSAATTTTTTTTTTPTTPVTAQDPEFSLTLLTDLVSPTPLTSLPQVDVNIGTVLLTAELLNISGGVFIDPVSNQPVAAGAAVPNQTVSFTVLAGPGTIGYITPVTDKNGVAKALFTTGNVNYTTTVIVEASATVDGKNYRSYTSFQIVRGTGVITLNTGSQTAEIDPSIASGHVFEQLIPFTVTDSNGNPRVNVPITLSVYSQQGDSPVAIDFLKSPVTEPNQQTITTDSAGKGIFNVSVTMDAPSPGLTVSDSIVYKAVTHDPIPVIAYAGAGYTLTAKKPTPPVLAISPGSSVFGSDTDIFLTLSGGVAPFTVTSSKPNRVTATINGLTVDAHLVDASDWTGDVAVTIQDSTGQTVSATLTRK